MMQVVIVGGGIGGLAAAIALGRVGVAASVFEREPVLSEVGAGLSLWPNGVRMLRRLGLAAALEACSAPVRTSRVFSADGSLLSAIDMESLSTRFGAPLVGIHRADLQALLRRALGDGETSMHLGAALTSLQQEPTGVTATVGGREVRADVLVGADGIHSAVRAALHGPAAPRHHGWLAWRGVVSAPAVGLDAHTQGLVLGRGAHVGWLLIGGGCVYWFATGMALRTGGPALDPQAELRTRFEAWAHPLPALIEATPPTAILRNELIDRPPSRRWGTGRVTLLGDAAHAMLPGLGQGANQALEDAVTLSAHLGGSSDPERALRAYEAARMARTARITRGSVQALQALQSQHPLTRLARSLLLRVPGSLLWAQQAWLYAYDVPFPGVTEGPAGVGSGA